MPPNAETLAPRADIVEVSSALRCLNVTPTSTTFIKPAVPTHPHYISLSNLDLLVLPVYSTLILLYRGSEGHGEQRKRLAGLKSSLSRVLVEFYPMAGRLVKLDDSSSRPCVHCNDEGVVWNEASADAELAVLEDYYPVEQLLGVPVKEAGPGPFYPARDAKGIPVSAVQATSFKCGGISLSFAWHHSVADGNSGWSFLRSWAEVSRGEPISVLPNHDRSQLQARSPPTPSAPLKGYVVRKGPTCGPPPSRPGGDKAKPFAEGGLILSSTSGMVLHKIHFSKERVDSLKEEASSSSSEVAAEGGSNESPPNSSRRSSTTFSSAVSLSAHLWKALTRSRELPEERLTHFSLTVDGRSKIPLPQGYFGNALSWASAESTAGELLARPLSYAAGLIQESISSCRTAEAYQSLIDTVEIHGPQNVQLGYQSFLGNDVAATFWTQMHLYELDFGWGGGVGGGRGGEPVFGGRNVIPRRALDGFFAVQPSPRGAPGSMLALAYLDSKLLDRLLHHHPEFSLLD